MLNRDRPAPSPGIRIECKRISSDGTYGISGDEYASEGVYFSPKLSAYDCPSANDDLNWMDIHGAHRCESYGSGPVGEISIEFDFLVNSAGFDLRSNVGIAFNLFMDSTLQDSFDIAVPGISQQPFPESFLGFDDVTAFNSISFIVPDTAVGIAPRGGINLDSLSYSAVSAVHLSASVCSLGSSLTSLIGLLLSKIFFYGSACAGSGLFVSVGFLILRTINSSQRKALNANEA